MNATDTVLTFTRTATCGHAYQAPKPRGKRALCDDCAAQRDAAVAAERTASGTVELGQFVRFDDGTIGQVWSRSCIAGIWQIADGSRFREMTSVQVADARIGSVADDVADLFAQDDAPNVAEEAPTVAQDAAPTVGSWVTLAHVTGRHAVAETEPYRVHTYCGTRPARLAEVLADDEGAPVCSECARVSGLTAPVAEESAPTVAPVTIAAGGIDETMTVLAPMAWHDRIRALSPYVMFGENYSRAVRDTLGDMSRQIERDYPVLALESLARAESFAERRATPPATVPTVPPVVIVPPAPVESPSVAPTAVAGPIVADAPATVLTVTGHAPDMLHCDRCEREHRKGTVTVSDGAGTVRHLGLACAAIVLGVEASVVKASATEAQQRADATGKGRRRLSVA
mgnify:FL=1